MSHDSGNSNVWSRNAHSTAWNRQRPARIGRRNLSKLRRLLAKRCELKYDVTIAVSAHESYRRAGRIMRAAQGHDTRGRRTDKSCDIAMRGDTSHVGRDRRATKLEKAVSCANAFAVVKVVSNSAEIAIATENSIGSRSGSPVWGDEPL